MQKLLFCLLASLAALPAAGQPYPSQPIRLIAPFPPGGSVDIMARLNGALRQVLESKEMKEKFAQQGFDPFVSSPEEAGKFIASEVERFGRLIKTRKITAE